MAQQPKIDRTYGGETAERRAELRGEKLIAAALEIIGHEGLQAATVRAVCARAGLTQRYYYEKFKNAEDMLIQVYQTQLEVIENTVESAVAAVGAPNAMLGSGLEAFYKLIKENPCLGRVVFYEVLGVSPAVDDIYREGIERNVNMILRLIGPVLDPQALAGYNMKLLVGAAVGAIIQVAIAWMIAGYDYSVEEITDNLSRMLLVLGTDVSVQEKGS